MAVYLGGNRVDYIMTTPEKPSEEKTIEFENKTTIVYPTFGYTLSKVTINPDPQALEKENINVMKSYEYTNAIYSGASYITDAQFEEALPIATQLINTITDGGDI